MISKTKVAVILSLLTLFLPLRIDSESFMKTSSNPPHIVFIVADDLGWNDVGWHNPEMLTPNLNWLAKRGVILDSVYAQPACTPSRNSFMTGLFPSHTELQHVIDPSVPLYLPLKHVLLPQRLKEQGYATHIVGKWHLGFCNQKYTPTHRGFDSFFGFYVGSVDPYTHEKPDKIVRELTGSFAFESFGSLLTSSFLRMTATGFETGRDFRFNDTIWRDTEGIYSMNALADRAIDIINRHDPRQPLFLYLPFQSPHSPLSAPVKYQRLYSHIKSRERRIYSGMVSVLDEAIGNITSALHKTKIMDNLLLVFTSDNGGHPYMGGSNKPLRGGKNTIWEGGTRVPSFVYSSTLLRKKGYIHNGLVHAVDWFPTFLHLAGAEPVRAIDGRNQWKMLSRGGDSSRNEFVYYIEASGKGALRIGDYKLIVGRPGFHNDWYPTPGEFRIARKRFRGGRFDEVKLGKQSHLLFNIKADPEERYDLSEDKPDILRVMLNRYEHYNTTKVAPFRPPRAAAADPSNFGGFWSPGWC